MDVEISIDRTNQLASLKSPKYLSKFFVSKAEGGYIFFKVDLENGPVPKELSGMYSSIDKAIDGIQTFLLTAKETQSAKNERLDKDRKERNAVTNSKSS